MPRSNSSLASGLGNEKVTRSVKNRSMMLKSLLEPLDEGASVLVHARRRKSICEYLRLNERLLNDCVSV